MTTGSTPSVTFTWTYENSEASGDGQSVWQIQAQAYGDDWAVSDPLVWDSGSVTSSAQTTTDVAHFSYDSVFEWRARTQDAGLAQWSDWSPASNFACYHNPVVTITDVQDGTVALTEVASASNGVNTNTFVAAAGVLNVLSTAGYAASGTIYAKTGGTVASITYMGLAPSATATVNAAIATDANAKTQFTTAAAHGFVVGEFVTVSGSTVTGYNGSWLISDVPSATTFKVIFDSHLLSAFTGTCSASVGPAFTGCTTTAGGGVLATGGVVSTQTGASIHIQGSTVTVTATALQAENQSVVATTVSLLDAGGNVVSIAGFTDVITGTDGTATVGPYALDIVADSILSNVVTDGSTTYYLEVTCTFFGYSQADAPDISISSATFAVIPDFSHPDIVQNLTATPDVDNGWVVLSWQAPATSISPDTYSYQIQRQTANPQGAWVNVGKRVSQTSWVVFQHGNTDWNYRVYSIHNGVLSTDALTPIVFGVILTVSGVHLHDLTDLMNTNRHVNFKAMDSGAWAAVTGKPKNLSQSSQLPAGSQAPIVTYGAADFFSNDALEFFIPGYDSDSLGNPVLGTDVVQHFRNLVDNRNPMLWRDSSGDAFVVNFKVDSGSPTPYQLAGTHFGVKFGVTEVRGYNQPVFAVSNQLDLLYVPGSVYVGTYPGYRNAPPDGTYGLDAGLGSVKYFEGQVNKHMAVIEWGTHWNTVVDAGILDAINNHNSVPLIDWNPGTDDTSTGQIVYAVNALLGTQGNTATTHSQPYTLSAGGNTAATNAWLYPGAPVYVVNGVDAPQALNVSSGWVQGTSPIIFDAGGPAIGLTSVTAVISPAGFNQIPFCLPQIVGDLNSIGAAGRGGGGSQDAYIDAVGAVIAAFGQPTYLRFLHEFNENFYNLYSPYLIDFFGHQITDVDFRNAYAYVIDRLRRGPAKVGNIKTTWCHAKGTQIIDGDWRGKVEDHSSAAGTFHAEGREVSVRGVPFAERVSNDHMYWARQRRIRSTADHRREDAPVPRFMGSNVEPAWVFAKDILPGLHEIGMPIDMSVSPPPPIEATDTVGMGRAKKWELRQERRLDDPEWWWLIGHWWGDGSVRYSGDKPIGLAFAVSLKSPGIKDHIQRIVASQGKAIGVTTREGYWQITYEDHTLGRLLDNWRVKGGPGRSWSRKTPPAWVEGISLECQRALVRGYFDADGCSAQRSCVISSIHLDGLLCLRRILLRLGIPSSIRKGRPARKDTIQGRMVDLQDNYSLRFGGDLRQLGLSYQCASPVHPYIEDGVLWSRVKSSVDIEDDFVPIKTKTEDYLTAFGRSHNCPYFWDRGRDVTPANRNSLSWNNPDISGMSSTSGASNMKAWNPTFPTATGPSGTVDNNAAAFFGATGLSGTPNLQGFVDVMGIDGYNYAGGHPWAWFNDVFQPSYSDIAVEHASAKIIICEVGTDAVLADDGSQNFSPPGPVGGKENWFLFGFSATGLGAMPNMLAVLPFQPTESHWRITGPGIDPKITQNFAAAVSGSGFLGYPAGT